MPYLTKVSTNIQRLAKNTLYTHTDKGLMFFCLFLVLFCFGFCFVLFCFGFGLVLFWFWFCFVLVFVLCCFVLFCFVFQSIEVARKQP